jgi:cytochrome c peroxidase
MVEDHRERGLPDYELLQSFHTRQDQAAFLALLRRHGAMVLGVCRSVLGNEADADDAFQATFLVLARKAGSIRKSASLGSWLHGVAFRTALKTRARFRARQKHEAHAPVRQASEPDDPSWREVQQVLHEELNKLSERYRVPLVLCYLEGKTQEQAVNELGVAKSTLRERLERGRNLLRARLVRRGLGPAALLIVAAWPTTNASAWVAPGLMAYTTNAACQFAAGQATANGVISVKVAALAKGVLRSMVILKTKIIASAILAVGSLISAGLTWGVPERYVEEKTPIKLASARTLRLPEKPYRYADIDLPAHFKTATAQRFDKTPAENPVTDHGATLGRVLFYDTRLSANNTISCGSCHVQKHAFVDPNRFSKGFKGDRTDRHALTLVNVRYSLRGRLFWDERASNLEEAVLLPIQSKIEMGQDLARLMEILAKDKYYPELFKQAFGDGRVTQERVSKALAQFLRSMVSYQSRYDEGRVLADSVRDDFQNFTAQENRGKALFLNNCAKCHLGGEAQDAHFNMTAPGNNGLDAEYKQGDGGVGDITLDERQIGLFKSPSLRNVEHTASYMHDGRFDTLEKVIDHYSKEVKPHPNLNVGLHRLLFTDSEKAALVAFLKTLTDQKFLTDPKFSDPFQ